MKLTRSDLGWLLGSGLATAGILFGFSRWARPYLNVETEGTVQIAGARIAATAALVSEPRLEATVRALAAEGSRLTGSPGAGRAADRLAAELRSVLGDGAVTEEALEVENPFDLGTELDAGGQRFRAHPFWSPAAATYRLPEGGRALGPATRASFADLARGVGRLNGRAAVVPVPGPAELRDLSRAAWRAGVFRGPQRDPVTATERHLLDGDTPPGAAADATLDIFAGKHLGVLAEFLFKRAGTAGVRAILFIEPEGQPSWRAEPRSFHEQLLKHPDPLPRYLVAARHAGALAEGTEVAARQAPAAVTIQDTGEAVRVHAVWPNMVRTSSTPRAGLSGPLVWAGRGSLAEVKGRDLKGAIVLVDYNCGYGWVSLADFGAKAVLFAEPAELMRGESEIKYLSLPADIPRFWVPRGAVDRLRAADGRTVRVDAQVVWEKRRARTIVGRLPGTAKPPAGEREEPVVIQASYDSISVVPDLAPGAEQAASAAALLELARVLKAHPLKKPVLFVLTPGHAQMMRGWAAWLQRHYEAPLRAKRLADPDYVKPAFVVHLDLTTRTRRLGVFFKGHKLDHNDSVIKRVYSNFGKTHAAAGRAAAEALGYGSTFVVDAINAVSGRSWESYIPGRFTTEQELTLNAGLYGVAYLTPDDERAWVDTPEDTPGRMDFESLARQTRVLACALPNVLNVGAAFGSTKVKNLWTSLAARVVEFDPRVSFLPDRTVDGAVVWVHTWEPNKSLKGVRGDWILVARGDAEQGGATFRVDGLGNSNWLASSWKAHVIAEAYGLDPMDGEIVYAPDRGPSGAGNFALETDLNNDLQELTLVTFPCRSLLMFDLTDPLRYGTLQRMAVLDARTDSAPPLFGASLPEPDRYVTYVEPMAVAFGPPDGRLKMTFAVQLLGKRAALVHSTPAKPEGDGFALAEADRLNFTTLHIARDLHALNAHRLTELRRHGIRNRFLEDLDGLAAERLAAAEAAARRFDWRAAAAEARASWGLSARVSPDVEATSQSVIYSAMFYLAFLIPFSFLAERLLFGSPLVGRQVVGSLGVFLVMFGGLYAVHPAFKIALTPLMILLAFIIIALSLIMTVLVGSRFFTFLREEREAVQGVHRSEVSRVQVAMAAFSLGVSNMRKRPLRTALTCTTLVVLTFAVLSLASVQQAAKQKKWRIGKPAPYAGLLFRATNWTALGDPAYQHLKTELAGTAEPVPRSWFVSYAADRQNAVEITRGDRARMTAVAALGLTASEPRVTGVDRAIVAGEWLRPGEPRTCLLPAKLAASLFIGAADVGHAEVTIFGVPFLVRGIFDPRRFGALRDLDDEELMPVNFESTESRRKGSNATPPSEGQLPQRYDHHDPGQLVILPHETLMRLGGRLASIAVPFASPAAMKGTIASLLNRLGLLVYAGMDGQTWAYSAVAGTAVEAQVGLVIPLLIAIAITFSTMLGAVQERRREIGVFSAVGLSPWHVFWLFMAEALVYAILGGVVGYLIGQGVAFLIVHGKAFAGLNVNFSAGGALAAVGVVMFVVLLSSLWPSWLASRIARPSQVTGFVMPAHAGDEVKLDLPFSFNARDAQAVTAFLAEWFDAHAEASAGEFSSGHIRLAEHGKGRQQSWALTARVWLAPYDFGVSQDLVFTTREGIGDESSAGLHITRLSGDAASWRRVNARFLKEIRKQFLIWRSLSEAARARYAASARALRQAGRGVTHAAA